MYYVVGKMDKATFWDRDMERWIPDFETDLQEIVYQEDQYEDAVIAAYDEGGVVFEVFDKMIIGDIVKPK